jgi:rubredoxin
MWTTARGNWYFLGVKCPKCMSGRVAFQRPTVFERFLKLFQEPAARDDRLSRRYRCGACHFVFTAPDRRLVSRRDEAATPGPAKE